MDFLNDYFQLAPIPPDALGGEYNWNLVILSYLVASLASYVALDITERIRATKTSKTWWLVGGAFAMGCGIWTMHFIGMLAFVMPMLMDYSPSMTMASMAIAIVASGFAFYLIKNETPHLMHLLMGGVLLGIGIVSMHYTGMAAMEGVHIRYLPGLFTLSIAIAIITSETALALMIFGSRTVNKYKQLLKVGSALLMGFAICGMHYTGMAAAVFTHEMTPANEHLFGAGSLNPDSLSLYIATATILVMTIALAASKYWLEIVQKQNQKLLETEAILEKQSLELRDVNESLLQSVEDLVTKEGRIRAILIAAADGIIVTDEQGTIEVCNRAAEGLFGYSEREMFLQNITKFLGEPEENRGAGQPMHPISFASLVEKTDVLREYDGISADQKIFPLEVRVSKSSINDEIFYTIGLRDIQARKASERRLATLNQQLVSTARLAGMAEVATGVLHNVGNVLNSINVTAKILLERDSAPKIEGLVKVSELLTQNRDNLASFLQEHPIGRILPEYLQQFADYWKTESILIRTELESLNEKVHHIKTVVAMQQSFSGDSKIIEKVDLTKLLDSALNFDSESFQTHNILIERDYDPLPLFEIDKVKTLQIFVNLIKNAVEALSESRTEGRKITVRAKRPDAEHVTIEVSDNGKGINPDNITKIFSYGFTTKKTGHGFGLHTSALSAQEAGGSLKAFSAGPNQGATFVLTLLTSPEPAFSGTHENPTGI